jgi:hypothetical protein
MVLVPLLVLAAYWFLILAPKRDEVSKAADQVTQNQEALEQANQQLAQLRAVQGDFQTEYASIVRLGKAIPSNLDMPSLLVQLDSAAKGTGIKFDRIAAGERTAAPTATPAGGTQAPSTPGGAAAAGGQTASTGVGKAAEKAGNAVNTQNQSSDNSGQLDATTSESARAGGGGLPVGGGASPKTGTPGDGSSGVPGLDAVTLDLDFSGSYFALSNFLHRMKRFVKVNNDHIRVSGRLITVDGIALKLTDFGGKLTASMRTTVYLVPKAEGVAAGATPEGPGATPAATGAGTAESTPTETPASGSAVKPPEAVVTP